MHYFALLCHAAAWVYANWGFITAVAAVFIAAGRSIHRQFPGIANKFPRLEAFLDVCRAILPDVMAAGKPLVRTLAGKAKESNVVPIRSVQ